MSDFPIIDAARVIIRAELDLFHATHRRPRPVTVGDLSSSYDAARRVLAQYPAPRASPEDEGPKCSGFQCAKGGACPKCAPEDEGVGK